MIGGRSTADEKQTQYDQTSQELIQIEHGHVPFFVNLIM